MFTHHVWVDHCTFIHSVDGSVDIKRGSSFITVSNNLFIESAEACMLGHLENSTAEAQDFGHLKVTYHHNWYRDCVNRMPLVRYGEAHVFNNYWSNVLGSAIGIGDKGSVYSENNYLDGGQFSYVYYDNGSLLDVGSLGGVSHNPEGMKWHPSGYYPYTADPTAGVKESVMAQAGAGKLMP
jgi:pectate lyase